MSERLRSTPDISLYSHTRESYRQKFPVPIQIFPVTETDHFEVHWKKEGYKSTFFPNSEFQDVHTLLSLLDNVVEDVIDKKELALRHSVTLEFPVTIGEVGYTQILQNDIVMKGPPDPYEEYDDRVKFVLRKERPKTNLLTFHARPIYTKDTLPNPPFQIVTAYPGEMTPRKISEIRTRQFQRDPKSDPEYYQDLAFWNAHAFIVLPSEKNNKNFH